MSRAFLVRHGLSQSNVGLPTGGPGEVALTLQGRVQGESVAAFFQKMGISLQRIVTSPYLRAKQTALYTQQLFPNASFEKWDVREFTYLSSLHKKITTLEERRPLVTDYWRRLRPFERDAEGSESFADFIERTRRFLDDLRKLDGENIAVFSHEQFINAVLWLIERRPSAISSLTMADFRSYFKQHPIANGEIISLTCQTERPAWSFQRALNIPEAAGPGWEQMACTAGD